MVIKISGEFTSSNSHKIWGDFSKIENKLITLDISKLTYADAEGTNYLMLLPFLFQSYSKSVQILTPPSTEKVFQFLTDCGVFEILKKHFTLIVQEEFNFENVHFSYNQTQIRYNNKFVPSFQSINFDSSTPRKIFSELSQNYEIFKWNMNFSQRSTACLTELIYNIHDHSDQKFGCITINFRNEGKNRVPALFLCISDLGIGIKNSFIKSKRFSKSIFKRKGDNYYNLAAVTPGYSCTDKTNRGFGLPLVLKESNKLIISSGCCRTSFTKDKIDYTVLKSAESKKIRRMIGTSIVVQIKEINK